jgi:hypothetical protein
MNKALRLPIILVALMLLVGIAMLFRPKTGLVVHNGNAEATAEHFDPNKLDPDMVINGRKVSEYATLEPAPLASPISAKDPKTWSGASVSLIKGVNGKTLIYFVDGSSREVTPTLVKLLPGELKTRLTYEGPQ